MLHLSRLVSLALFRNFGSKKVVFPEALLPGIAEDILPPSDQRTRKYKSKTDLLKQRQRTRREIYKVRSGAFPVE